MKAFTLEQVEERQRRAVIGLENLGLDGAADEIEALTPEEWAETKGWSIKESNPSKSNSIRRMTMAAKTRQELLDDVAFWQERAEAAEDQLDAINDVLAEGEEAEDEGDADDEDSAGD